MHGKKIEFFYTAKSFVNNLQRSNLTALNPSDNSQAYIQSANTEVYVVNEGKGSFGELNTFYEGREKNNTKNATLNYNFIFNEGSLSFTFVLTDLLFKKNKTYETFATYREGIFSESDFPKITARILDDPDETRIYTINY